MEPLRVDICYRPLRIGWVIGAGDIDAFRTAARFSFALWGGRFNPIIVADSFREAEQLVNLFRVDFLVPIGNSPEVKGFPKQFPHLVNPFLHEGIFVGDGQYTAYSQALDVYNVLMHLQETREEDALKDQGLRIYKWSPDDPLADVFLMQFGEYPLAKEVPADYLSLLKHVGVPNELEIDATSPLPKDIFEHPSISFISRYRIARHYGIRQGWGTPGFYSGDVTDLNDLICYWNLRAADVPLLFVDVKHIERYGETLAARSKQIQSSFRKRRDKSEPQLGVWFSEARIDKTQMLKEFDTVREPFKELGVSSIVPVGDGTWNGRNVSAPMMHLGETSTLGVVSTEWGSPRISFSLDNKPFSEDSWFHVQHLVASLSFLGGWRRDEEYMLVPPYVPELNEFYSRTMHFDHNKVKIESERIGLIVEACDKTTFVNCIPVIDLVQKMFDLAGFSTELSAGGLIARQLITQLGGVDGARVFKIPGVRRLLKTYGPTATFTKKSAVQLIAGKDPQNPAASFKDYEQLYGGHHPFNTKLDPGMVFSYLVEKGLFRIGAELKCPHCRMDSWTALDQLKQRVVCDMCGREFDATQQLVAGNWHYRRSGLLGAERNAQGAIPVVLTLQQFAINLSSFRRGVYLPSVDLTPKQGSDLPKCESDFVWIIPQPYPERTVVLIGECKDQGGRDENGAPKSCIDATDIEHLRVIADALPKQRFCPYIVLAKLSEFTPEEIALARTLNSKYINRVILLTARELEPYHLYERTVRQFKNIHQFGSRPEELARNTTLMYFKG